MKKGKFIVIEGVRGAGKSTAIKYIQEKYTNSNVVFTREPGGSPFAEMIRGVMLHEDARQADGNTQFGLIWASRADHMKNLIVPALISGKNVITDRFDTSTYGLQIYAQESQHLKDLFFAMRKVVVGDFVPDLYVFLDVDPLEGARRVNQRQNNISHFHDREPAYYERMREGYLDFIKGVPHAVVDANKSFDEVKKQLDDILEEVIIT